MTVPRRRSTRHDHADRMVAGAVALITVFATTSRPLAAQEVIELPAEDRLLDADFEEIYRLGAVDGGGWDTFGSVEGLGFDGAGNLYILDTQAVRISVVDPEGNLVRRAGCRLRPGAHGLLACSEGSGHVIHIPQYLGWARAYTVAGDLAWHSSLPDFVTQLVVPAAGGGAVKYEFDPDFNFSHGVAGAAIVGDTHLALSISVSVPRGQEPEVPGLLALLALEIGEQTRRDDFGGVVVSGLGERVAVVYREPFPTLSILKRGGH